MKKVEEQLRNISIINTRSTHVHTNVLTLFKHAHISHTWKEVMFSVKNLIVTILGFHDCAITVQKPKMIDTI